MWELLRLYSLAGAARPGARAARLPAPYSPSPLLPTTCRGRDSASKHPVSELRHALQLPRHQRRTWRPRGTTHDLCPHQGRRSTEHGSGTRHRGPSCLLARRLARGALGGVVTRLLVGEAFRLNLPEAGKERHGGARVAAGCPDSKWKAARSRRCPAPRGARRAAARAGNGEGHRCLRS